MKRPTKAARRRTKKAAPAPKPRSRAKASKPPASLAERSDELEDADASVTVVGVGASAGGLEAFSELLESLEDHPNVAIVLVQHLSPQHESALPSLLSIHTRLPVVQVAQGTRVEQNHVYVIPPNAQMEMHDGELRLSPRPGDRTQYTPIDIFFRSLAATARSRAIGVVLSGSASDGAIGLREIKAAGGFTIVQDPETARYDGMPRAAIATESVDLVLAPSEIGKEIRRLDGHAYRARKPRHHDADGAEIDEGQFRRLFMLLRKASNIDFTYYKPPTIQRRLQRRMVLQRATSVDQYLRHLGQNVEEARKLVEDILIQVTRFFREPESFDALAGDVFSEILKERRNGEDRRTREPIRIWVPGCATGEEAYSVAITLLECLGDEASEIQAQIFATDVSEAAIDIARAGVYPLSIAADVSPERLRRFFTKTHGSYKISAVVRDLCVFARQDLTRDAPFSKLDLIVCRNVLIYLGAAPQQKLLGVFHYALRPSGFLMLGPAETTTAHADRFDLTDKKHRIYRKRSSGQQPMTNLPIEFGARPSAPASVPPLPARPTASMQSEVQRVLLERYAPPGVIVDEDVKILQFLGHTGRFLEPPSGDASLTLPRMVRDGLLAGLRNAFQQARRERRPARRANLHIRQDGHHVEVAVEVVPLQTTSKRDRRYLVLFQESAGVQGDATEAKSREAKVRRAKDPRIGKLEEELAANRDYLQSIIQELEAANEELQSANEEILSSNEELQSTNEELDTAKEELQSTNEELNTVNDELQGRNEELLRVNSDLVNLLNSVHVALVIIEADFKIRRFTTMAERVLNLIPTDIGRPIGHIKPNIDCPDLEQLLHSVIDTVRPEEREVRDLQGRWFSLQIRPYKNLDNRIEGAVLALFDIDDARRVATEVRDARDLAESIIATTRESLVVLDGDLRVKVVNRAFCETFRVSAEATEGELLFEIGDGQWNVPALRTRLGEILAADHESDVFDVEHEFPKIGKRRMRLNARRIRQAANLPGLVLLAIEDVTPA